MRLIERAEEVANTYLKTAQVKLAELDRMGRKAEADNRRFELTMQQSQAELVANIVPRLTKCLEEGNVIRAKAYNRSKNLQNALMLLGVFVTGGVFLLFLQAL